MNNLDLVDCYNIGTEAVALILKIKQNSQENNFVLFFHQVAGLR